MRTSRISALLGLTLLLAASALAADKTSITVRDPLTVNGKTLAAGNYTVVCEGTGPALELSIRQGKTVVAKVPGRLVNVEHPAPYDSIMASTNPDGTRSFTGVQFKGKPYRVEVGEEPTSTAAAK